MNSEPKSLVEGKIITWKQVKAILLNRSLVKEADDGGGRYDYTNIYHEEGSASIDEADYHEEMFSIVVGNNDTACDASLNIWDDSCFIYGINHSGHLHIKCNDDDPEEAWELEIKCYSKINLLTVVDALV